MNFKKKYTDYAGALTALQRFCAYQERSHSEVRNRLLEIGIYGEELDRIIVDLINDNFLNEERFAKVFARGKSNIKKWGRIKIENELKFRKISTYCIRKGMEEIDEHIYVENLRQLLRKKHVAFPDQDNQFRTEQKLYQYAIQKGYEADLISSILKEMREK
ncbi:MAG: regulatory protein RecX [Saprospiraceae bacterium]